MCSLNQPPGPEAPKKQRKTNSLLETSRDTSAIREPLLLVTVLGNHKAHLEGALSIYTGSPRKPRSPQSQLRHDNGQHQHTCITTRTSNQKKDPHGAAEEGTGLDFRQEPCVPRSVDFSEPPATPTSSRPGKAEPRDGGILCNFRVE